MQQVVYIHGGESFQTDGEFLKRLRTKGIWDLPSSELKVKWTDRLAADLGPSFEVFMPAMPNKNNASFEAWSIWFERHFEYLKDGVILIGCSLGAMFLAKYLSQKEVPFSIKTLILMAAPVPVEGFDLSDAYEFVFSLQSVPVLAKRAGEVEVWQSEDDFVVPYSHGVALAKAIPGAKFVSFTDKNHFLVPELPEMVTTIQKIASSSGYKN